MFGRLLVEIREEGLQMSEKKEMTREEAIKSLQNIVEYWTYRPTAVEAAKMAISALRPVSREQVEKVFPGCRSCKSCRSCVFSINNLKDMPCKKCDPNAECVLTEYKPSNFCPVCGKPLTDEAVEMLVKRLEALYEKTD